MSLTGLSWVLMLVVIIGPMILVIGLVNLLANPRGRGVARVMLAILSVAAVLFVAHFITLTLALTRMGVARHLPAARHEAVSQSRWHSLTAEIRESERHEEETLQPVVGLGGIQGDVVAEPSGPAGETAPASGPDTSDLPADPPAWLQGKSTWTRENAYWTRIRVGPFPRDEIETGADRSLPRKVEMHQLRQEISRDPVLRSMFREAADRAIARYTELLQPGHPVRINVPMDLVLASLVADAWLSAAPGPETIPLEPVQEYGDMVDLHLLLKFDSGIRRQLADLCRQKTVEIRMGIIGAGLSCLLVLLGGLYLCLKTWRRPARSGAACVVLPP